MPCSHLCQFLIGIKGAGEMGSAIAWRLHMARMRNIFMTETRHPLAVRRRVSFCEALWEGVAEVEGVTAVKTSDADDVRAAWKNGNIAVITDPEWCIGRDIRPDVLVDAILAKRNLGTRPKDAPLVIGLGPGFTAGSDVHMVIETHRGHNLGRIITAGCAEPNTGIPGDIGGHTATRVLKAPVSGVFQARTSIGEQVRAGDITGTVAGEPVLAGIDGVIRGLIRSGTRIPQGMKVGDIDPRGIASYCHTISDKARAISGSVLEAILRWYG